MRDWLVFFLHGVHETAQASAQVFRDILALKERIEREVLPRFSARRQDNAHQLIRHLYRQPIVDVKAVSDVIGSTVNTGLTEAHLVKTLYGLEPTTDLFDRDFQNHKWFLVSNVLRPLTWAGFLVDTRASNDRLAERIYWKTPLWSKCLVLDTDHYLERRTTH